MKLFVADKINKGYTSKIDYNWCDNDEILMFGQFQVGNGNPTEVSMCGIKSRKFTTHIIVKDLDVPKDFVLELITESIEQSMNCAVNNDGSYTVELGDGFDMKFNINDTLNELLEKASKFKDSEKVICRGRDVYHLEEI